jgi:hypothetical protein
LSAKGFLGILGGQKIVCCLGALDRLFVAKHRGFEEKSEALLHLGPRNNLVN